MIKKQHIGCKVMATEWDGEVDLRGMIGYLRSITNDGEFGLIEYPENIGACDGTDQEGHKVGKAGHCYWHKVGYITLKSHPINYAKKVVKPYKFRGRQLEGKPVRVLGTLSDSQHAVVEFNEDVGGHSADGHGKKGRCLILPVEVVKR